MDKSSSFSATDPMPFGKRMYGLDIINRPEVILGLVRHDHGMHEQHRESLISTLDRPGGLTKFLTGVAGAALTKAITSYAGMSKPAQTLLSLAGFGIGNILYSNLHKKSFTEYNSETGETSIKL